MNSRSSALDRLSLSHNLGLELPGPEENHWEPPLPPCFRSTNTEAMWFCPRL